MDVRRHLDRRVDVYCGSGNPVGEMIAWHMEELTLRIRWLKGDTPEDYEAQHEIVEQDARDWW
jgi:hypothetical protein